MARDGRQIGTCPRGSRWCRRVVGALLALAVVFVVSRGAVFAANALGLWTRLPAVPTSHQFHKATLLGDGRLLVAGGLTGPFSTSTFSRSAELYLPATDQWLPVASMAAGRAGFGAALAGNGRVVVAGGWQPVIDFTSSPQCGDGSAHRGLPSVEIFDPSTLSWTTGPAMSQRRADFDLVRLFDGRILAAGGSNSKAAEIFNPATNAWSSAGTMFSFRANAAYTRMPDGRVMVAGGNADSWPFCSSGAEVFDPATNSWSVTNPMSRIRAGATATVVRVSDGTWRVLVAGGYDPQAGAVELASAELYDPATNSWSATGSMNSPRAFHTATLLTASGRVLVTGGRDSGSPGSTAEVFDPTTLQWTFVRGMSSARAGHTATHLLIPGVTKVVVVGGTLGSGTPSTPSAELFQPTPLPSMISLTASGSCQPITLFASVASATGHGSPTGNVSFWDGQVALGTHPLDPNRQVTLPLGPLTDGTHDFSALYSGDGPFNSQATMLSVSVRTPPSVSVAGPSAARALGTPVTLTALVTGGTGPYSFTWDRNGTILSGGATLVDTPPLGVNLYAVTVRDAAGCSSITTVRQVDVFDFQLTLDVDRGLILLRAGSPQHFRGSITLLPGSSTNGLPFSARLVGSGMPKDLELATPTLPFPQASGATATGKIWLRPGIKSLGDYASVLTASAGGGQRSASLGVHLFDYSLQVSPALADGYRSGRPVSFTLTSTVTPGSTAALPPAPPLSAAGLPSDSSYVMPALPLTGAGAVIVQSGSTSSGDFPFSVTSSSSLGTRSATATLRLLVDPSPPVVGVTINGIQGANGWYVSDVEVIWTAGDLETGVSTTGCTSTSVVSDTAGTTLTCTATSGGGMTARSVTIFRDTTPPTLTVPGTITRPQDQPGGTVVTYTVTASDNVDPNPAVTCTPPSGSLFPLGDTTVTCQATNAAGLTSTASFLVSVIP